MIPRLPFRYGEGPGDLQVDGFTISRTHALPAMGHLRRRMMFFTVWMSADYSQIIARLSYDAALGLARDYFFGLAVVCAGYLSHAWDRAFASRYLPLTWSSFSGGADLSSSFRPPPLTCLPNPPYVLNSRNCPPKVGPRALYFAISSHPGSIRVSTLRHL